MPNKITINDVRSAGHCVRGTQLWFVRHNLDFRTFLKEGIDEEIFLSFGDALARRVVRLKQERESEDGR